MSYIRATETGDWEDVGPGLYVYSHGDGISYLPTEHEPFVEVVMRMLDQSGELDDETLNDVHHALRHRLRMIDDSEIEHNEENA